MPACWLTWHFAAAGCARIHFVRQLADSEYDRNPQDGIASVVRLRKNISGCF